METKTCSLTEDEIRALIKVYANELTEENIEDSLERMTYLNRRLKAEKKDKIEDQPKAIDNINNQEATPTPKALATW